jgi:hypothetical protein
MLKVLWNEPDHVKFQEMFNEICLPTGVATEMCQNGPKTQFWTQILNKQPHCQFKNKSSLIVFDPLRMQERTIKRYGATDLKIARRINGH